MPCKYLHLPELLGEHPAHRQRFLALLQTQAEAPVVIARGRRDFPQA